MNLSRAKILLCAAALLNGCSAAGSQLPPPGPLSTLMRNQHHPASPPQCMPSVWASASSVVRGYTAANTTPCVVLNGSYNGLPFHGIYSLAIGTSPNYLYVADLLNSRVVVFDYNGNYVKWLDTKLGTTAYNPWGVCVSSAGVVGVGNIRQQSLQGNVEFFQAGAPNGSQATGYASGSGVRQTDCAFDSAGNFYVLDGNGSGTSHIDYLASSYVGAPGQTLVDAGLGNSSWAGMYSRINSPADQTLSVAIDLQGSATQRVDTWTVSGPSTGPLTFSACACSPYVFHNYPHPQSFPVEQVAPSAGGASGVLYFGDFGANHIGRHGGIRQGPANGGQIQAYALLRSVIGVATNPSGQY